MVLFFKKKNHYSMLKVCAKTDSLKCAKNGQNCDLVKQIIDVYDKKTIRTCYLKRFRKSISKVTDICSKNN